jgi:hypothetical protein
MPNVFDHASNAAMSRVALVAIPRLADRFDAELPRLIDRIERIDQPPLRVVRGDAMLAATLGLRVVR